MNALLLPALRRVLADGVLASLFSGLAVLRSSRTDLAHQVGMAELRVGKPPLSSRAATLAMHTATSVMWGALYDRMRALRRRPGRLDACTDALLLAAVAAGIDRVVGPRRLTPGADKPASSPRPWTLYGGFAAGLAVGGLLALRHSRPACDDDDDEARDQWVDDAPRRVGTDRDANDDRYGEFGDALDAVGQHLGAPRPVGAWASDSGLATLKARASALHDRLLHLQRDAAQDEAGPTPRRFGGRA
ncbi:hypothetical protein [Roseateles amylovorans]|uniref:DUF4126 domain-containing protein n=1 Tax=Roseateles amylovorans TaxID=2978473 RepID=A0ABY6B597_9BURK|nr:hypothetical protein [Roseateles amylovorans]UXH80548.1 hypothetical protein N4261_12020 [Roseateles amylovorans]